MLLTSSCERDHELKGRLGPGGCSPQGLAARKHVAGVSIWTTGRRPAESLPLSGPRIFGVIPCITRGRTKGARVRVIPSSPGFALPAPGSDPVPHSGAACAMI
jgi:hypothetical protein